MTRSVLRRSLIAAAAACLFAGAAQASVDTYKAGDRNDPRLREARFLSEDKRHLSALTALLRMQIEAPTPAAEQFPWLLADNYLSFGLRERADTLYQGLAVNNADPLQYDRARLKTALFEYTRGYWPEARATLLQLREGLPEELLLEWQDLTARVLMAMGRDAEAIDILTAAKNGSDQTDFTRYNLGVALIRSGRVDQGRTVLEKVGKSTPTDRDSLALVDRANMTLGWNFLQAQQGAAAKPILRRVRVEGPYSNRALLGLGWAELTEDGSRQRRSQINDGSLGKDQPFASFSTLGVLLRRGLVDDPAPLRRFRGEKAATEREEALKAALPAWLILVDRDPQDPTVQEAWLAIPYALEQIGAHDQARSFYEQAVDRLEQARKRTDLAVVAMATNRMVETIVKRDLESEYGWDWELKDLPDAPETYYLQTLLAEHRFAEGLKNYRDMRLLTRNLDAWDHRLEAMQKNYERAERPSVDTGVLFARAKQKRKAEHLDIKIDLSLDPRLAEPGRYVAAMGDSKQPPAKLSLAGLPPTGFVGTYERIRDLRTRVASLKPLMAKAGDEQGRQLQIIGTRELKAQKDTIEKYLVQARFALARLYDRPTGANDPDEYEIKKK